jgi:hypothetical protein
MDRRLFVKSLFGAVGAAWVATALAPRAHALPLLDELKAMDAAGFRPLVETSTDPADLPAQGAIEAQYYYGPPRHRYYGRPYRRPARRRCRTYINRYGQRVRRCWVG